MADLEALAFNGVSTTIRYERRVTMESGRVFDTWATTECDECKCDFQVTRTTSKTVFGRVWCSDCQQWEKAYNAGFKAGQESAKT